MSVCMAEGFDVQRQLRTFYRAVYVYRRTAEHYRPLAGERQIAWNKVRDKPLSETSLFILGKIAWNESIAKNATVRDLVNALYLDQGELHDLAKWHGESSKFSANGMKNGHGICCGRCVLVAMHT